MKQIEQFYDSSPQTEWERLERHRTEFAVTQKVLLEFLPKPPTTVLDIGGGPGRYALWLAQQGYGVTLLDLSAGNLEFARTKAAESNTTIHGYIHGNALDLSGLEANSFDAVVMLGPLYHLLELPQRQTAVAQALRVLKDGGLFFAAFITRFAFLRDCAANYPEVLAGDYAYHLEILRTGQHDQPESRGFTQAYFSHPDEVLPLMEGAGLQTLRLQGCEGVVSQSEEKVNALEGQAWEQWVELNHRLSQEPSLLGASDHLIYVGRK